MSIVKLHGVAQQYAWGKVGSESMVAKLCKGGDKSFVIDESETYAELWMGTHVKAPSRFADGSRDDPDLRQYVSSNPQVLGAKVTARFGNDLPYLFKVLSVNKALSIQAHPDKKLAEKLHAERPDIYKDPNHKPEMAIALTRFEALCGFRPMDEIISFLDHVPELRKVVGEENFEKLKSNSDEAALKACFSRVIFCDKSIVGEQIKKLVARVKQLAGDEYDAALGDLLLRLNTQFPADVGCFVIYFLNRIHLEPGEAIFLKASVPHAYLDGDCIECMACSDNVVRAGLTPKLIDAQTLIDMLEYKTSSAAAQLFKPQSSKHEHELIYDPPVDDFSVYALKVPAAASLTYELSLCDAASVVIFVRGEATHKDFLITDGTILFVPANATLQLSNISKDIVAYRATCLL